MPHRDAIALIHYQEPLVRAEPEGGATRVARDEARLRRQGDAKRVHVLPSAAIDEARRGTGIGDGHFANLVRQTETMKHRAALELTLNH